MVREVRLKAGLLRELKNVPGKGGDWMALTAKQKLYCQELVANGHKQQAAYMSAYPDASPATANVESSKLMKRDTIKDYIKELQHDRFEALNISADRIACELAKMAFADLDDTNTTASKARALDLLQKQLGLQTQKVQASTEQSIKISIKQKEKDDGEGD